ncbi:uncharacterized protein LOC126981586 isoform X2 [Eriocheir sinensis]|uniref:uncharacterized protein LOC126981586 isoform X2 n=1 Tax=Eriocheir sinensis TaxID=95602 RepID=UPI0021C6097E|nr:uncharacterized protein LOC126981586 isoform X2 [Eriocheir sinensis]
MKGLPLTKSVLLALTLLLPATHGRTYLRRQQRDPAYQTHYGRGSYNRQDARLYGRLPFPNKPHYSKSDFLQLFEPSEPLNAPLDPITASLEEALLSNDLDQNLAISREDWGQYSARPQEPHQGHGLDRIRHHGLKTYNEEVCSTKKGWDVVKESVDLDGNAVVIIQVEGERNQTYYSYTCENKCQPCKNVMGASMCKQRFTYVYLYHYLLLNPSEKRWGFVEVPSHCACELVSPDSQDPECDNK